MALFDLGIERVRAVYRFHRPFWRLYLRGPLAGLVLDVPIRGNKHFLVKRED